MLDLGGVISEREREDQRGRGHGSQGRRGYERGRGAIGVVETMREGMGAMGERGSEVSHGRGGVGDEPRGREGRR